MSIEELIQQGQQAVEAERRRREAEETAQAEAEARVFAQAIKLFIDSVVVSIHPTLIGFIQFTPDEFNSSRSHNYVHVIVPNCAPIRFVMNRFDQNNESHWTPIDSPYILPCVMLDHDNYNLRIDGFMHAEAVYSWRDYTQYNDPALALAEAMQRLEEFEKAQKEAVQDTIKVETRLAKLEDAERQSKADPTLEAILSIRKGTQDTPTLIFTYIAEELHIANAIARDRMDCSL